IGPDPRGRKRALIRSDTAAIGNYLDDPSIPLDNRGKPWLDIAEDAGITLPTTIHFKPPGVRTVNPFTIRKQCKDDEEVINAKCEEEKELTPAQARNRTDWVNDEYPKRPTDDDWKDITFYDEFHFGLGPQVTKRVKRKRGGGRRYAKQNVHRKKVTAKDTKAKAREEEHLKLLNIGVAIGFNWRLVLPYTVPNSVGKMTTKKMD
ncbi:hypothetical protein BJ875DRAFT_444820, partial [Amylocarpus encephaloides]